LENSEALNILIIDDEDQILNMLSQLLSRKGYGIDTSNSGEDGLRKIELKDYNLIITDIKMPGISGNEVSYEIKKIKGNSFPVIGMSGTPWLLDNDLFDAVLVKPFSQKELFEIIEKLVFATS
jgi:DNA-binding response OmpR family regulator